MKTKSRETQTATYKTRIIGVVESESPDDGKWVIYCEHFVDGEWSSFGLITDSNKQRLARFIYEQKRGEGYTDWCDACQYHHSLQITQ